jgi:WD40 repeat protein/serine/threonine protein kinase
MAEWNPKANDLFLRVAEIEASSDRRIFLDQHCGDDAPLRAQVESLLAVKDKAGSFLNRPVLPMATVDEAPVTECPGTVIGPYKLLEQIGEGGFGVVFMAEQQHPVRRKVALKVLKPGMDTRQVIARFEAERQALALMDHPNIAHVFDGGETASSRPYFVMELIRGIPITDFCDHNQLPIRERLELFVVVCQAVQHAHQKGIIHRDLKPSNVLVTLHDDKPVVKVIDFGIAKATGQQLTEKTLFTNFAQLIGTPLYMSPEQAQLNGLDIDTRSDIYSLGVLLYELLTGTTPFDKERLRTAGYDEMLRIIREEEPVKPSTRISTLGQAAPAVSAKRQSDLRRLAQLCRGELDWIVMKPLEKDRNRRYESASAFAADVQRYLHDEPVQACPSSAAYRMRKFARRHKRLATGIAGLIAAVVFLAGSTLMTLAAYRTEAEQRQKAETNLYRSLLEQMRATRRAWETGYRAKVWELLAQALQVHTPDKDPIRLRQEAAACLGDFVGVPPTTWEDFRADIYTLALHPEGNQVLLGLADGTLLLRRIPTGVEITLPAAHRAAVDSLSFSADGTRLASLDLDGTIKTWQGQARTSWACLRTIPLGHPRWRAADDLFERLSCVVLSPDGQALATYSRDHSRVLLFNAADGIQIGTLPTPGLVKLGSLAFSPDGKLLAAAYRSNEASHLLLWDVAERTVKGDIRSDLGIPMGLVFRSDGKYVACAGERGGMLVEVSGLQRRPLPSFGFSTSTSFSRDNTLLAFADKHGPITLWDFEGLRQVAELAYSGASHTVAFSKDGKYLVAANKRSVRLWDLAGADEQMILSGHQGGVASTAFSPDGKLLASAGKDRTVRIWNPYTGQLLHTVEGFHASVQTVAFSPDGRVLGTGDWSGAIRFWDVATWAELASLDHPLGEDIWAIAFAKDDLFAACGKGGLVIGKVKPGALGWHAFAAPQVQSLPRDRQRAAKAWHTLPRWSLRQPQRPSQEMSRCLSLSPDGKLLAWTSAETGLLHLWDVVNGQAYDFPALKVSTVSRALAFTQDSKRLVFVGERSIPEVWDMITKQKVSPSSRDDFTDDFSHGGMALSADNIHAAVQGRRICIWDVRSGKLLVQLLEQHRTAFGLGWSPRDSLLAVSTADGLVLWNIAKIKARLDAIGLGW